MKDKIKGLTTDKVMDRIVGGLDELVEQGKLTEEQKEEIENHIDNDEPVVAVQKVQAAKNGELE